MMIFYAASMSTKHFDSFEDIPIIRYDHSAITETPEVLTRKETKASCVPKCTYRLTMVFCTKCLRTVFHNFQLVFARYVHDGIHFTWQSV